MARPSVRNFLLNVVGSFAPMLVAVAAVPVIAHYAGTESLGFLGLAWTLIGYLGLLDLGLARVVMRRVAQAEGAVQLAVERGVVTRVCRILFSLSVPVVLAVGVFVPVRWLVGASTSPALLEEAGLALHIVLAVLPFVIVTGVLRGVLEGRQQFRVSNLLKVVFGALTYLAPMLVALWQPTLPMLVGAIAATRLLALFAHVAAASAALPRRPDALAAPIALRPLLAEGGWYTLTSIISPVMVSFDRFAVASLVSLSAAAYYIVPQDVVLRLLLVPVALAATVFPLMAQAHGTRDEARQHLLGRRGMLATLALGLPMCMALALAAEPVLRVWMGAEFARGSAAVTAIFAIGLLANTIAQVPYSALQAAGRADLTAKLHLAELPGYIVLMLAMTWRWGLVGAAIAWGLRTLVDALALLWVAGRVGCMADAKREIVRLLAGVTAVALAAVVSIELGGAARIVAGGALLIASVAASLHWINQLGLWRGRVVGRASG